jgi:hypothetical protein
MFTLLYIHNNFLWAITIPDPKEVGNLGSPIPSKQIEVIVAQLQ